MAAHSPIMREVRGARRQGHAGARHLQRLSGADRGGAAARRAAANRSLSFICRDVASARREQPDDLYLRLRGRPDDPRAGRASRRQLHRRSRRRSTGSKARASSPSAIAARAGETDRRGQLQRLGPRDRRHLQRDPHRARPDAASRERHRPAARRHRRPRPCSTAWWARCNRSCCCSPMSLRALRTTFAYPLPPLAGRGR